MFIPPAVKFVIPAIVVDDAPKLIDVEPIVTLEFDNLAFAIEPASCALVMVPVKLGGVG